MDDSFSEIAARLAGLVPQLTGWPPDTFWNTTPEELAEILSAFAPHGEAPVTRTELNTLLERDSNG